MQDRSHMRSPHGNRLGDRQDAARRLTRRAALLGAAAGIGALAANGGRPALAALTLDLNRGQHPAVADRAAGFPRRQPARWRSGARHFPDHHGEPQAQRLVRPDRSGRVHRKDHQHRRAAALSGLACHQCPGPRDRPHHPPARRPHQGRVPTVGRATAARNSPASSTFRRRTISAASPTSSRTRSTSGSPARKAISTAASCSSTKPAPRSGASSASP